MGKREIDLTSLLVTSKKFTAVSNRRSNWRSWWLIKAGNSKARPETSIIVRKVGVKKRELLPDDSTLFGHSSRKLMVKCNLIYEIPADKLVFAQLMLLNSVSFFFSSYTLYILLKGQTDIIKKFSSRMNDLAKIHSFLNVRIETNFFFFCFFFP